MQRTVNINGKEYPLEDEGFALRCLLNLIVSNYKDIERFKKENMLNMLVYKEQYLQGLKSAYYFMTGENISDDEIKELAGNK